MAIAENLQFLASPLTAELFDRTEQQRVETTAVLNAARRKGVSVTSVTERNTVLFADFVKRVDVDVEARARDAYVAELASDGPACDYQAVRLMSRQAITWELESLNEALPLPALDRITEMPA